MFLKLKHQKLDIYEISRQLVPECYKLTNKLPVEEKFGMIVQIRRGASGKSETKRKRYYEVARGSVIEIDGH